MNQIFPHFLFSSRQRPQPIERDLRLICIEQVIMLLEMQSHANDMPIHASYLCAPKVVLREMNVLSLPGGSEYRPALTYS